MTRIFGILNVTRDSFSDGGRFLDPDAAVEHALRLVTDGADVIDVGAESTHPDSQDVPADEEIARLTPVILRLKTAGICVSVDTYKPVVMRHVTSLGASFINDVTALRQPGAIAAVRDSRVRIVLMHSTAATARAQHSAADGVGLMDRIVRFFERRLRDLEAAGIVRDRLILDPGLGFFLGSNPTTSVTVLRELPRLVDLGLPVLISPSRKSFLGALLESGGRPRPVAERWAATLAAELWAARHGATYIRTHDVRPLRDALTTWQAIENPTCPTRSVAR